MNINPESLPVGGNDAVEYWRLGWDSADQPAVHTPLHEPVSASHDGSDRLAAELRLYGIEEELISAAMSMPPDRRVTFVMEVLTERDPDWQGI